MRHGDTKILEKLGNETIGMKINICIFLAYLNLIGLLGLDISKNLKQNQALVPNFWGRLWILNILVRIGYM